jgi:hypothetical protein
MARRVQRVCALAHVERDACPDRSRPIQSAAIAVP